MKVTPTVIAVCVAVLICSTVLAGRANYQNARKANEFTGVNWENAMANLDSFTIEMQNVPQGYGVVFVYGGQARRLNEANAFLKCMKDYLVMRRRVDVNRLIFVNGGYRDNVSVELWLAQDRADAPNPSPTIKPAAVKFKGRRITNWRSLCSL